MTELTNKKWSEIVYVPTSITENDYVVGIADDKNALISPQVLRERLNIGSQTITGSLTVTGNVNATAFIGDGSGLTGIGSGTGGIINTGSTTIGADSDNNGVGDIALQTSTVTRITIKATTGFVGIGTIIPARQFSVVAPVGSGGGNIHIGNDTSGIAEIMGQLMFGNPTDSFLCGIRGTSDGAADAGRLDFYTEKTGEAISTRMSIDSEGNIGVNTSIPVGLFDIKSSGQNTTGIADTAAKALLSVRFRSASDRLLAVGYHGGTGKVFIQAVDDAGTGSNTMALQPFGGAVGIGTISPSNNGILHLYSEASGAIPSSAGDDFIIEGGDKAIGMSILSTGGNNQYIYFGDDADGDIGAIFYSHSDNSLKFRTNTNTGMTIDSSSRVGIGTDSPAQLLDILSASSGPIAKIVSSITPDGTKTGGIFEAGLYNASSGGNPALTGDIVGSYVFRFSGNDFTALSASIQSVVVVGNTTRSLTTADLVFSTKPSGSTNPTERMSIDSAGNIMIGAISPTQHLHIAKTNPTIRLHDTTTNGYAEIQGDATGDLILKADEGNTRSGTVMIFRIDGTNYMTLDPTGSLLIGETGNTKMTQGLTINQGVNDDEILAFKSSDIAHGLVTITETDTYASFKKAYAAGGGVRISGITDGDEGLGSKAVQIIGYQRDTADTTTTIAGQGVLMFLAYQHDGADNLSAIAADGNLASWGNHSTTEIIFKGDGDIYTNTDQTTGLAGTFDNEDDLSLINALRYDVKGYKPNNLTKQRGKLQKLGIMSGTMLSDRGFKDLTLGGFGQVEKGLIWLAKQLGATEQQLKQAMIG